MHSPKSGRSGQLGRVLLVNLTLLLGLYALAEIALHVVSGDHNPLLGTGLRIPDRVYHHALRPNFDGYDVWGPVRYRIVTDSLGFKDASTRAVPMTTDRRRVVFIGDSFTEGVGLPYEQTFVGRFAQAFPELDVLNAGVVSYAPSAYYEKLKHFIEVGLKFDEAIVYIDISDVRDEAVGYCYDENAVLQMRNLQSCGEGVCPSSRPAPTARWKDDLKRTLYIPDFIYQTLKRRGDQQTEAPATLSESDAVKPGAVYGPDGDVRASWTYDENTGCFGALGIEGGIRKAKAQMDRLYQVLSAHGIALSVGVYPWPQQLLYDRANSRQVTLWRDWCAGKCRSFFDHFPAFFRYKQDHPHFLKELFVWGDVHYNALGERLLADDLIAQYRSRGSSSDARTARRANGSAGMR